MAPENVGICRVVWYNSRKVVGVVLMKLVYNFLGGISGVLFVVFVIALFDDTNDVFDVVLTIVFGVAALGFLLAGRDKRTPEEKATDQEKDRPKTAKELLESQGIVVEAELDLETCIVFVSPINKLFGIITKPDKPVSKGGSYGFATFNFSQVIKAKKEESNRRETTSSTSGSGGFGGGSIRVSKNVRIGGGRTRGSSTRSSSSATVCYSMGVRFTLNDLQNPTLFIPTLYTPAEKTSMYYQQALNNAEYLVSLAAYIKANS